MFVARKDPHLNEAIEVVDRHLEKAHGDIPLAWTYLNSADMEFVRGEIERCLNFRYYSENYHVIQSEFEGMKCLYPWWDSQEILYSYVITDQLSGKKVKILVLKARQEGISELVQAMLFHKTIFTSAVNTLVIAQDPGQSNYLFNKSRMAYDALPWWMRPEKRYDEDGAHMVFDRVDAAQRMMDPGLQSRLMVEAANKMTGTAVGKTLRAAHMSEVAEWYNPRIFSQQLMPTMNAPDMLAIAESTARGRQGLWFNLWKSAIKGELDWRPVFIEAYRVKKYSLPIPKGEDFQLTPEETAMCAKVKKEKNVSLSKEFVNWRRRKIQEFVAAEGEEFRFYQEYPLTWMEAFQASGTCAFNRRKLQTILETYCSRPICYGEIDLDIIKGKPRPNVKLTRVGQDTFVPAAETRGSRLYVWEMPQKGETYYIGGDSAEGIIGQDYSALHVIKVMRSPEPDIQVASWHGWISPVTFGHVAAALGYWFNGAEIAIEFNSSAGATTNGELQRVIEYPNMYRWKHRDKIVNSMSNFLGWYTNQKSRGELIIRWREAIDEGTSIIRDENLIEECLDFSRDEGDRRYDSGDNDRLFAAMICNLCAHDQDWAMDRQAVETEDDDEDPEAKRKASRVTWANTEYSPTFDGPKMKGGKGTLPQIYQDAAMRGLMDVRSSTPSEGSEDDWRLT